MNEVIEQILAKLFDPEKRRLNASLDNLINEHAKLVNKSTSGFLFNGTFYCLSTVNRSRLDRTCREGIAYELVDKMLAFLADKDKVQLDYIQIKQTLYVLLKKTTTEPISLQDCRDSLPDFIVLLAPQLKSLPRQHEYENLHTERVLRQSAKALEKIYVYAAGALLY